MCAGVEGVLPASKSETSRIAAENAQLNSQLEPLKTSIASLYAENEQEQRTINKLQNLVNSLTPVRVLLRSTSPEDVSNLSIANDQQCVHCKFYHPLTSVQACHCG